MEKRSIIASTATVSNGIVCPNKQATFTQDKILARLAKFQALYQSQKQRLEAMVSRDIEITLPDGKVVKGNSFKTTPFDIALKISKKLAEKVVVAKIQYSKKDASFFREITNCDEQHESNIQDTKWELLDLSSPLEGDCALELVTFESPEGQETFWHSSAHVLGRALENLYSGFLTHGPPLKTGGFFYDVYTGEIKLTPDNYQKIEEKAMELVSQNQRFEKLILTKKEALDLFGDNPFKVKLIETKIEDDGQTTAYRCGDLIDLCTGPHIYSTNRIKAFKVLKNSASYWLANQNNDVLQRVYAISFESKKQLEEYNKLQQELANRDHRNILESQNLVHFNSLTPGCAFYLKYGTRIFNNLVNFMRNQYTYRGFTEVNTPNLFKNELWKISGHYFKYKDDMFFVRSDDDEYGVKPMNCPSHCLIFGSTLRSYRDLPIRLADFGVLHRNEASGALGGLTRVRKFHQDDAHIFCREDQIVEEILASLEFLDYIYEVFGFQYSLELSTRPEKYLGTLEKWATSEKALSDALDKSGRPWTLNHGDGAFYGPKIDIKVLDCYKRKHQLATIQLDFNLPMRFNLQYKEKDADMEKEDPKKGGDAKNDNLCKTMETEQQSAAEKGGNSKDPEPQPEQDPINEEALKKMTEEEKYSHPKKLKAGFKRPVIVHRAILGSLERCIAILCEHFGGKWPFWLSPRQVAIIPVSAKYNSYGEKLKDRLTIEGYFAEVDDTNLTLNKRIRNAQLEQYNVIIVVGEKEENTRTVAIRYRDSEKIESDVKISQLIKILREFRPKPSKTELQYKENALYGDDEFKN